MAKAWLKAVGPCDPVFRTFDLRGRLSVNRLDPGDVERKVDTAPRKTILPIMIDIIDNAATVYTDASMLYTQIDEYFLTPSLVNHYIEKYVRGSAHTNKIDCSWSALKRTIGGTYTHVRLRHLDRCLAEQAFRFDGRKHADGQRFAKATKGVDGKRITYKRLIAKA